MPTLYRRTEPLDILRDFEQIQTDHPTPSRVDPQTPRAYAVAGHRQMRFVRDDGITHHSGYPEFSMSGAASRLDAMARKFKCFIRLI